MLYLSKILMYYFYQVKFVKFQIVVTLDAIFGVEYEHFLFNIILHFCYLVLNIHKMHHTYAMEVSTKSFKDGPK